MCHEIEHVKIRILYSIPPSIRNAILDHSLPGVHGALLVGISIVLRYSYSVGLSIAIYFRMLVPRPSSYFFTAAPLELII